MTDSVAEQRQFLQQRLIGQHIPRLWCPPLTHYKADGALDTARQAAHWAKMCVDVGGMLVPGSTGEGWEMEQDEITSLLDVTLDLCQEMREAARPVPRILVGVLRTEVAAMVALITQTTRRIKTWAGTEDTLAALAHASVCGFTVCPPAGADLSQAQIRAGLEAVLDLGVPIAIYQLPQVTQNEMSSELVADLAARYPNFILFKDTSGEDRVAMVDQGESGVFLVRGAEGNYAQWLRESGGPYHGLLLSTANSFPAQLGHMITLLEAGEHAEAQALSKKLTRVVEAVFALVADFPHANAFTNANKAVDHWMAYGERAGDVAPPMLHAGVPLPESVIAQTGAILDDAGWLPMAGYLK